MPAAGDLDRFFGSRKDSRRIFDALANLVGTVGPSTVRVTKSQVAFWRDHPFAWAWMPGQYLRRDSAPLVLTVALRHRDTSSRWKEVVEPRTGRFTHHLELESAEDLDAEVRDWLREAWESAGQ